jgi:hypothetical protein
MHNNDFEQLIREVAREYRRPPETPRREMWLQLQHARFARRTQARQVSKFRLLVQAAGIAATLALGVGLGRLSVKQEPAVPAPEPKIAVNRVPTDASAYRVTMTEHLRQTEVFLTLFQMSVRRHGVDSLVLATARPLLATNRVLLDSPAGADFQARKLLQDLEFVLAQIAQLSPQPMPEDLNLIETGIEQTAIMTRLWNKAPVGSFGS